MSTDLGQNPTGTKLPKFNTIQGGTASRIYWLPPSAFILGTLVLPRKLIAELGLVKESSAEAILADGHSVELETFACFFDWFGNSYETQVAANEGEYPLLGTMLLDGHHLHIDYRAKAVELT